MDSIYQTSPIQMFALFFLMLGPMRLIKIFIINTNGLSEEKVKHLALHSIASAAVVLTICGFVGKLIIEYWNLTGAVINVTAGVVFAVSAFLILLGMRERTIAKGVTHVTGTLVALTMIITPFGIATLVMLLTMSKDLDRMGVVFAALYAVLLMDFLAMYFVRRISNKELANALQIPSVLLGVIQLTFSFDMIYIGIKALT